MRLFAVSFPIMPFILLAVVMVVAAVFVFMLAAMEHSREMVFGGIALILAGAGLLTLFLVFHRS